MHAVWDARRRTSTDAACIRSRSQRRSPGPDATTRSRSWTPSLATFPGLWTCNNGPEQQWHLDSVGIIWNPNANRCLDDPSASTTLKTQLQTYDCNYTDAQNWMAP
ncbi:ricin-type beta-trefoil lectin domain protein [Actinomadura physcomitrii]|uniref:ricin-type beta-trefoil lectin domain protein n=1 Tax=Actinomadura physcomitrii TaxID=2650748 RepID=UPI0038B29E51